MSDIPNSIILGIISGVLGALFIFLNNQANILRKKFLTTKWKKCLECVVLIAITASVFYLTTLIFKD